MRRRGCNYCLLLLWSLLMTRRTTSFSLLDPYCSTTNRLQLSPSFSLKSSTIFAQKQQQQRNDPFQHLNDKQQQDVSNIFNNNNKTMKKMFVSNIVGLLLAMYSPFFVLPSSPAMAVNVLDDETAMLDSTSNAVTSVVQSLEKAGSNAEETFGIFEQIAAIIREGEGVGGSVSYKGIELNRGYVEDEDTTIYNPGLALLTETEKNNLVDAMMKARAAGKDARTWTDNNEVAFDYLKSQLDPYFMTELSGYLKIFPFFSAILYAAVVAVQQFGGSRKLFRTAYLVAAAALFVPVGILIAIGI